MLPAIGTNQLKASVLETNKLKATLLPKQVVLQHVEQPRSSLNDGLSQAALSKLHDDPSTSSSTRPRVKSGRPKAGENVISGSISKSSTIPRRQLKRPPSLVKDIPPFKIQHPTAVNEQMSHSSHSEAALLRRQAGIVVLESGVLQQSDSRLHSQDSDVVSGDGSKSKDGDRSVATKVQSGTLHEPNTMLDGKASVVVSPQKQTTAHEHNISSQQHVHALERVASSKGRVLPTSAQFLREPPNTDKGGLDTSLGPSSSILSFRTTNKVANILAQGMCQGVPGHEALASSYSTKITKHASEQESRQVGSLLPSNVVYVHHDQTLHT